ncbi:MAG: DUF4032 domain-containing protein [Euzebyales bacterium]|nr:DUF4032 domain-containing protein [Euzebyales bacterium]MBA3620958.1 DUF4032 domain-containing protein [Euzebyales bacterium]
MVASRRGLRILTRAGHPNFLDLPWDQPLQDWDIERCVEVARGAHRHVVRFVAYDGALYALKELPPRVASREYRMLRKMAEEQLPVVEAVGVVDRAGGPPPLEDVLITRYLDYSLPYRVLFTHRRPTLAPDVRTLSDRLLDALVMLLVRLHLAGFFWGDCSLNNTLFRRDAGALAAYLVDAETGEWHPQLTDGQRGADLEVTKLNVAGGLLDVQSQLELSGDLDPVDTAEDLERRYRRLWRELTTAEAIGPDERFRIEARMRRLNELGFDVDEVELVSTDEGERLLLRTVVTEAGHHRRRLLSLTGLEAQENQARSLLNDLANFRAHSEHKAGWALPETVAAYRWLSEIFDPTVTSIPEELRAKLEPVEVFHEVVEHKWFLSERAGRDVGISEAVASYMRTVLPDAPDERLVLPSGDEAMEGWIGFG